MENQMRRLRFGEIKFATSIQAAKVSNINLLLLDIPSDTDIVLRWFASHIKLQVLS